MSKLQETVKDRKAWCAAVHRLQRNRHNRASAWMDLKIIILSEVNQKDKNKYHTTSLIHGI